MEPNLLNRNQHILSYSPRLVCAVPVVRLVCAGPAVRLACAVPVVRKPNHCSKSLCRLGVPAWHAGGGEVFF